jgi:redox-sensitive bicupin YhaK (pirin superfamily)
LVDDDTFTAPEGELTSCLLYVRRGSVQCDGSDIARQERLLVYEVERGTEGSNPANAGDRHGGSRALSPDNFPTTSAREVWTNVKGERGMTINAGEKGLDALLLVGIQLLEPVLWEGPFVQADAGQVLC